MKNSSEQLPVRMSFCVVLFGLGTAAQATTFSIKAVKHNPVCTSGLVGRPCFVAADCDMGAEPGACGGDITPTNTLTVTEGDIIVTEVYLSDWSPKGERARVYQLEIDRFSFFNDGEGGVVPVRWDRSIECFLCIPGYPGPGYPGCPEEWPNCIDGQCYGPDHDPYSAAFVDDTRGDWIFADVEGIIIGPAIDPCDYRYGGATLYPAHAVSYAPPPKYAATLILEILPDSSGTFTIDFVPEVTFLLNEGSYYILPFNLEPLVLTICGDGACTVGEDCETCSIDCSPTCGDGVCECGESYMTCSADCTRRLRPLHRE